MNSEVNILNFKPQFLTNRVAYSREENDGYFSFRFITPALTNETILNSSCVEIIKMLDGETSLKDIVDYLIKKYKISNDIASKDVAAIVKNFLELQLVTWEGVNPFIDKVRFELGDGYSSYLADYTDVNKIINYFKKSNVNKENRENSKYEYVNPYVDVVNLVNEETLKSGFLTKSQFIFLLEKDGEIRGVFFGMNNMKLSVNTIISVIVDPNINIEQSFLEYVFSILPQIYDKPLKKFRIYLLDNEKIENTMFNEELFIKEVTLEDELGYNLNLVEYNYHI
ncbi:PqqD family protein [Clostridium paraputrificum]|uniref:PqqD family protein n=1 Tax=Clostridium paraputrificum TaxID=29363 RepID=UPI003D32A748